MQVNTHTHTHGSISLRGSSDSQEIFTYTPRGARPRVPKLHRCLEDEQVSTAGDKRRHQTSPTHLPPEQTQASVAGPSAEPKQSAAASSARLKGSRFKSPRGAGRGGFLGGLCMSFLCLRGLSRLPPTVPKACVQGPGVPCCCRCE